MGRRQVKKDLGDSSRPVLQVCKGQISLSDGFYHSKPLSPCVPLFLKRNLFPVSCFHVDLLVCSRTAKLTTLIHFPDQGH